MEQILFNDAYIKTIPWVTHAARKYMYTSYLKQFKMEYMSLFRRTKNLGSLSIEPHLHITSTKFDSELGTYYAEVFLCFL